MGGIMGSIMGDSGAATNQAQNTSTFTDLPDWYKGPAEQLAHSISGQLNQFPSMQQTVQGGGTAPVGGVFNGGATAPPPSAPVNPQGAFGPLTPPANAWQGYQSTPPFDPSGGGYKSSAPFSSSSNNQPGSGIGHLGPGALPNPQGGR